MAHVVAFDTGVVWSLVTPVPQPPPAAAVGRWARDLLAAGIRVLILEVVDFEVRRELIRRGATAGLARLDRLGVGFEYVPITTAAMRRAAALWAQARHAGRPTADPRELDADCILAAQALEALDPGDRLTVATANVGHLGIWVPAVPWAQIAP
jgi:predicted nucleic acid-binding protein